MFYKDGGESHVGGHLWGYLGRCHALCKFAGFGHNGVTLLDEHSVEDVAEHRVEHLEVLAFEDDAILLASQYGQGFFVVVGSHADFEEYLVHLFGNLLGDGAVGDEYAAEGAYRVASEGVLPCVKQVVAACHSTCVVVLQDGEGGAFEIVDEVAGGVDIAEVIVGYLLAVEFLEAGVEITVEPTFLVGVLAVAQHAAFVLALTERVDVL